MTVFFIVNIILLISSTAIGILTIRKSDEVDAREKKLNKTVENTTKALKDIRKAYEDIIAETQPLKDEQKNCKRGDWCKTCSFCKKVIIPIYSPFDEVQTIEMCAKGICKEYAQKQGGR